MARAVLLVACLLVVVVTLCGATTHEGSSEQHGQDGHEGDHDDHAWNFHLGHHEDFDAWAYLDDNGYSKGFFVDLIQALCKEAHKRCYYLIDDYANCWKGDHGDEHPGVGLLAGWYDGCVGFFPTPDRLNSFDFTEGFAPSSKGALYFRAGEDGSDMLNLHGKNVGFVDGWAMGQHCLNRQHGLATAEEYNAHFYKSPTALVKALHDKEVDVVFTTGRLNEEELGVESVPRKFNCVSGGLGVMMRKGNELKEWWNEAFEHFRESGKFTRLCVNAQRTHGHRGHVNCIH